MKDLTLITDESQFKELERLGRYLKVPIPLAYLDLEVKMPDGRILHSSRQRSRSWVRNTYNAILLFLANCDGTATYGAGLLGGKEIGGAAQWDGKSSMLPRNDLSCESPANAAGLVVNAAVESGIVIGSSDTAESFEDFALASIIHNGSGAGQLNYAVCAAPTKTYTPGTKTWDIVHLRYFNNNFSGDVTAKEAGLYVTNQNKIIMTSRDVFGVAVVVPATGQLKVTYTFTLIYPA